MFTFKLLHAGTVEEMGCRERIPKSSSSRKTDIIVENLSVYMDLYSEMLLLIEWVGGIYIEEEHKRFNEGIC